ncbi:MAG: hypothetical protein A4E19_20935 [Nitrospira sp. SG-bin1]|nr:MAG: hypothetical protein A4E19_20935 [Nitrospira sp. SG-bin1]
MCGIAGFVDDSVFEERVQRKILDRMCFAITHRGPDDQGTIVDGPAALGMRRLSIIDVAGGHQPILNEDGTVSVVFNGEIYNYSEIRAELEKCGHRFRTQSDTEVIVHAYEEYGPECVSKFRGMFAYAIWDRRSSTLVLTRDRVGKKPLHYTLVGRALIFGSEIKSLLQHPSVRRVPHMEALSNFLTFGYIPDPATAYKEINKLPPGYLLIFRNGVVKIKSYWDWQTHNSWNHSATLSEADAVHELRQKLVEAVRIRLISEVPLGAFLSGGIDSSTVVGLMAQAMNRPVKTFSIGFTEGSHDELDYARLAAGQFQTDHHEFVVTPDMCSLVEELVWHHDEPFADASSIPTYVVSKMAREYVTVVLTGDGGDEVFAGYDRYLVDRRRGFYEFLPRSFRDGFLVRLGGSLPQGFYGRNYLRNIGLDAAERFIDSLCLISDDAKSLLLQGSIIDQLNGHDPKKHFRHLFKMGVSNNHIDHQLYLDSKTYLPGDVLTKVDRMTMANSVEARAPFLDHLLIEFASRLPSAWKLKGYESKYILKQAVKGLVPQEILRRQKKGFGVPLGIWIRGELRPMVEGVLTDLTTSQRGIYHQAGVRVLLNEHMRGRRDNSHKLWALLMMELWFRTFIDRFPATSLSGPNHAATVASSSTRYADH